MTLNSEESPYDEPVTTQTDFDDTSKQNYIKDIKQLIDAKEYLYRFVFNEEIKEAGYDIKEDIRDPQKQITLKRTGTQPTMPDSEPVQKAVYKLIQCVAHSKVVSLYK